MEFETNSDLLRQLLKLEWLLRRHLETQVGDLETGPRPKDDLRMSFGFRGPFGPRGGHGHGHPFRDGFGRPD